MARPASRPRRRRPDVDPLDIFVRIAWLVGAAAFVIGLMRMNSPATARNGNLVSAAGMTIAIVFTFLDRDIDKYWLIAAGMAYYLFLAIFPAVIWELFLPSTMARYIRAYSPSSSR